VKKEKLNAGCGTNIKSDCINLDIVPIPGVDVVHDLNKFPWPFKDNTFGEIYMINILEHLHDTIKVMEELHRITKNGGLIHIRVPYWNSYYSIRDPTHIKKFHKESFDYFNPNSKLCQVRPHYTKARFKISKLWYWTCLNLSSRERCFKISNSVIKRALELLANHFCNVIYFIEVDLWALK